jgi:hypothetical protein
MPSTVARPIPRVQEAEVPVNRGSTWDGLGVRAELLPGSDGSSRVCSSASSDRSPVLRGTVETPHTGGATGDVAAVLACAGGNHA